MTGAENDAKTSKGSYMAMAWIKVVAVYKSQAFRMQVCRALVKGGCGVEGEKTSRIMPNKMEK